ncbi:lactate utilization protein|uniref:L-lactate dehydrogenase complex protein LldG n=1 Tax=Dendrosporobacter quercicolus TaxID=146817 RepID=A0A1G9Z5A1_9FIRM|nr:lactate utilization protein [Dendrosporobacter quercicolus]NSL48963.1 lactate utilization protein [Dendrosporobacter quercicolus DSM 1736]SDN15921.1 L-lactate dehydrogenase complex protein LldG [Dendrosporobacter quercicolus]
MAQGKLTGDREAFFSAIRNRIKTPPGSKAGRVENPMDGLFTERGTTVEERRELRERFIKEWKALGGQAFSVGNRDELANALTAIIRERGIQQAVRWDHPELEKLNLREIFAQAEAKLFVWPLATGRQEWIPSAESMEAGVVWGDIAMAETGTLVLPGGAGQPTTVSILPITLIAVFTTAQLVDGFYSVMKLLKQRYGTKLPTTTTFIAGPSRTSDIEMDLTIGVHGSKYVYVCIMDE